MTDDDLADVVDLFPTRDVEDEDAPVSSAPSASYCSHVRVELHAESRRVVCRDCDREVEAFAYLLDLARRWESYATHRKEAERRARLAQARLSELLRLERNARSRLRKLDPDALASAPPKPWGEN